MTATSTSQLETTQATLQAFPPSAKLVLKILEYEGELTQQQLAAETLLSQRTVRDALNRLEDQGVVTSRISFMDARKRIYGLSESFRE